jgi:hypothetical protein
MMSEEDMVQVLQSTESILNQSPSHSRKNLSVQSIWHPGLLVIMRDQDIFVFFPLYLSTDNSTLLLHGVVESHPLGQDIVATVQGGKATLKGFVDHAPQRTIAEQQAFEAGASVVDNRLQVKKRPLLLKRKN